MSLGAQIWSIRRAYGVRGLGDVSPADETTLGLTSIEWRRAGVQGVALAGTMAGGALTGYLAAGTRRGAEIGALTHLGLFGLVSAIWGGFSTTGRVACGLLGLVGAAGAGYLVMYRSRR